MDLDKLRTQRTIFKRTKARPDLPRFGLYVEWLGGTAQRRILDEQNAEHVIDDKALLSYYKLVNKAEAKALLARYWPAEKAKREQTAVTVRHDTGARPAVAEPEPAKESKPKSSARAAGPKKVAAKKTAAKPGSAKKPSKSSKPAKKSAKKSTSTKAPKKTGKKTANKKAGNKATKKKARKKSR